MGDSQIHRRMARTEQPKFHRVNAESRLNIAAVFQQIDRGSADERLLSLAVDTKISETRLARIAVTQRGDSPDADLDDLYVIAGADQRLSGNLLVFLEVFVRVADGAGADESALVAGVRFDL